MSTTLITGGAGFVGSHLVDLLLARGDRVLVADDLSTGRIGNLPRVPAGRLGFVRADVRDAPVLDALVDDADRVVHLAAAVGVRLAASDPVGTAERNVVAAARVLRACARAGRPVLLASSSEVYGPPATVPFREDADLAVGPSGSVRGLYATSKLLGEQLAFAHARQDGLRVTVARLFNTVGPRQLGRYGMVPRFVRQALDGEPITVHGDGSQRRCFCHVADVVRALADLLDAPRASGTIVNLGSDVETRIETLAETVKRLTGSASPVVHVPFESVYGPGFDDPRARRPDLRRARELIGFHPGRDLEAILADVIEHENARSRPRRYGVREVALGDGAA